MAKCDVTIELDDPAGSHLAGGTITGVVHVHVDADVHCKGLDVSSVWRTHGRGNVASNSAGAETLFAGDWSSGESPEYRFELPIAGWPPTYHGNYLNVDHYVDARAKIPWGFDPKASEPFMVRMGRGPIDMSDGSTASEASGIVGCILGLVFTAFLIGFMIMLATAGVFALFLLVLPIAGVGFWFFRVFLPKYALGEVEHEFENHSVSPGQTATGHLTISPRKNVSINGVTLNFRAREQCVSGSGSNRTTHTHVLYERVHTLQEATTLNAGQQHRFPLEVQLPEDAPYSLDLDDNDLIWSATLRVDIPRWPDWVQELPLQVVPPTEPHEAPAPTGSEGLSTVQAPSDPTRSAAKLSSPSDEQGGITFQETAHHAWAVRDDRTQIETLAEAVSGLTFDFEAVIERRLLYGGDDDPHVYKDGYAVWARYPEPELPLVLYVPHELADEFEQIGREVWRGRGTVVGWDSLHGRLQIKLERPSAQGGPA